VVQSDNATEPYARLNFRQGAAMHDRVCLEQISQLGLSPLQAATMAASVACGHGR
jgi:hypothetical protein